MREQRTVDLTDGMTVAEIRDLLADQIDEARAVIDRADWSEIDTEEDLREELSYNGVHLSNDMAADGIDLLAGPALGVRAVTPATRLQAWMTTKVWQQNDGDGWYVYDTSGISLTEDGEESGW